MANMSYCRFENTAGDLTDCWAAMDEAVDENMGMKQFLEELSSDYERSAYKRLVTKCREIVELHEALEQQKEEEDSEAS